MHTTSTARRRGPRIVAAALLATTLAACSSDPADTSEEAAGGETSLLRVAQSTPAEWVQPVLAAEEGTFGEHDLEVEMTEFPSGRDALQALTGGAVEIAMVTPSNVAPAVMGGQDIVVFGVASRWGSWRLVARDDRGIAEPSDLRGKTIGVPTGTSADQSLDVLLTENGLSREDVEVVNVAAPDVIPALESGSVDAINIWQPNLSVLEEAVPDSVSLPFDMPSSFLFATSREFAEENEDLLLAFMEANQANDSLINDDRERALDIMVAPSRIDREILSTIWEDFDFETSEPDSEIISQLDEAAQFAIDNGSQPGPAPDFDAQVMSVGLGG